MKITGSTLYSIILGIIFAGYVFFFASPYIFHDTVSYVYTEINSKIALSKEVTLQLEKWLYSSRDNSMIVMLTATNTGIESIDLNWTTVERHSTGIGSQENKLKTNIEYPTDNLVIVSITGVPSEFEEIALSLQLVSTNDVPNGIVKLYTNCNQVEQVNSISEHTATEYRIEYLNLQIEKKQEQIQLCEDTNKQLAEDNKNYEQSIAQLIANEAFETTEEITNTEKRISTYRSQIRGNEETITKNKYEIEALKNSIQELQDTISKLQNSN